MRTASPPFFFKHRRENFTPNCNSRVCSWHFPKGKDAGPTRFAWNEGKPSQFPDNHKNVHKQKKALVPASVKTEKSDEHVAGNADTQTATASTSLLLLQIENDMLREENEKLKKQLEKQKQTFSFSQISDNPERVHYYTGLPDAATVLFLEGLLSKFELNYHSDWTVQRMPLIDQLFLTLMKLKLNCGHVDLATRFNCSTATVTNIFTTLVSALYDILYVGMLEKKKIPLRAKNQTTLPDCFQPFPNCRIVLDCTVSVSNTERLDTQSRLYSQNKGCTTLKALIGVAPNGLITFASDLYGESASDKPITADCGALQHLQPGDTLIADKRFTVRDIPEGVSLNNPSFLVNGQFTQEEVNNSRLISCARTHVEPSIQRLKLFSILDHIPHHFKKNINKILKVCVCLSNLKEDVVSDE
uniref:THAP-type domain-containing protein n=1 Tax=Amphilophus citrinellus TaxID=61819 RepID=A0A3Q0SQK6_AMPCI